MLPKKKLILLLIPFFLFASCLTAQLLLFFNTTSRIEPVTFPSVLDEASGTVEITSGNLFYPKDYEPGRIYPVVIIVHGFEVTKTTDLRLATELTKRGVFALPIDLPGHGHTSGVLQPYFWKAANGAVDYIYSRPNLFNLSAVGMCGHSLGGWATFLAMGYEAGRLDRINACVTWAGVFNTTRMLAETGFGNKYSSVLQNLKVDPSLFANLTYLFDHNPVNYYNGSLGGMPTPDAYGSRILIVQGTEDGTVPYSQVPDANSTLAGNASFYIVQGGDHWLLDDTVIEQTILHFEHHFFGIDPSNSTLSISNFTYLAYYVLYILTLIGLFFSVLSLVFIVWYYKLFKRDESSIHEPRGFTFVLVASLPYIGILFTIYGIQQLLYNLFLSLLIGSGIFFGYTIGLLAYLNRNSLNKDTIWKTIRSNFQSGSVLTGFHLGLAATLGYLALSYGFGILTFSPLSIEYLVLALLGLFPFVLSHEIFLRKVVQDNLPLKNRWVNRIFMGILSLFMVAFLVFLLYFIYLAIVAMLIAFAAATLTGIFLYAKFPSLGATSFFITIITGSFAANCYFFFI